MHIKLFHINTVVSYRKLASLVFWHELYNWVLNTLSVGQGTSIYVNMYMFWLFFHLHYYLKICIQWMSCLYCNVLYSHVERDVLLNLGGLWRQQLFLAHCCPVTFMYCSSDVVSSPFYRMEFLFSAWKNSMKFLLIYNIFYSMWYAEHVMSNEYLQTDGIEGRVCWLVE